MQARVKLSFLMTLVEIWGPICKGQDHLVVAISRSAEATTGHQRTPLGLRGLPPGLRE